MGLLDDAIKQHLELKRKHGAPEEEVQRQEEEALGPVRREAVQQPEGVEEAEAGAPEGEAAAELGSEEAAESAAPSGGEQLFDGETFTDEDAAAADSAVAEQPPFAEETSFAEETPRADQPPMHEEPRATEEPVAKEAPPATEPRPVTDQADEPVLEADPEAPEPAAGAGETPPRGLESVDDPTDGADPGATVEYDPFADQELEEEEAEPAASNEEGDVLEDTPDFLQETPEHDRLWFEQKPPRDFDFE
jgi:hypothetical protein